MRKIIINGLFMMLFLMQPGFIYSQQKIFEQVTFPKFDQSNSGVISGITQDKEGYIWFITQNKGLYRYDGSQIVSYVHDAKDSASIIDAPLQSIAVDSDNVVWIGSLGGGLDKFDPSTNKFMHFRHQAAEAGSLANDTLSAILVDQRLYVHPPQTKKRNLSTENAQKMVWREGGNCKKKIGNAKSKGVKTRK